jgi:sulfoxide reductase heme-binding subunit YedZ
MKLKITPLQFVVHSAAFLLSAWVIWDLFFNTLNINPIQTAMQHSGKIALIFLTLSLACTPLNILFGLRQTLKLRRTLGLFAFMFAAFHFSIFVGIDYAFNWSLLKIEFIEKRFVILGLTAGTILALLAITSFKWWQKKLGKNWKRLHKFVYLAAGLVIVHYTWAKKGDLFSLQGDILGPLAFGLVIVFLLVIRIPAIRKFVKSLRGRVKRRQISTSTSKEPANL